MTVGIVISVVVLVAVMGGAWLFYRRTIAGLDPHRDTRAPSGTRLTAEKLRTLPHPPWRVVYEIGEGRLGAVDHVVVGPGGPIAIETVLADRPAGDPIDTSEAAATAAIRRADVDDLTVRAGVATKLLATVYWGVPRPDEPPASAIVGGQVRVEGQRLDQWLMSLPPGTLGNAQVDLVWQAVVTGIGRPDPLG